MKIAIIGAARVRTPLLIHGLAEARSKLGIDELAFWDTDSERLRTMGRVSGGIEARVKDENIALAHGLVGQETVGAGGFACAMRNLAVMLEYARLIERVAPRATVV